MHKILFIGVITALSMASCSSGDTSEVVTDKHYPIRPTTRLVDMSRAIMDAGSAFSASVFLVNASGDSFPEDYTGISALPATVAANGAMTITPEQYYQMNGDSTALLGVYPAVGSGGGTWDASVKTVTYTVDGKTDIMATAFAKANKTSPQPALTFSHFLTQIHVSVYAADQTTIGLWGDVQSIAVVGREPTCVLTLPDPGKAGLATTAFSGTVTDLSLTKADGSAVPSLTITAVSKDDAQMFGYCMFAPLETATALTLKVVTTKGGNNTVTLPSTIFGKGKAYAVTLKMTPKAIVIDDGVIIDKWENGTTTGSIDADLS
jgi:hypothetical protein